MPPQLYLKQCLALDLATISQAQERKTRCIPVTCVTHFKHTGYSSIRSGAGTHSWQGPRWRQSMIMWPARFLLHIGHMGSLGKGSLCSRDADMADAAIAAARVASLSAGACLGPAACFGRAAGLGAADACAVGSSGVAVACCILALVPATQAYQISDRIQALNRA